MPVTPPDNRPPMVVALEWVALITTLGFEMALPALGGWWLDQRWKTSPWCLVAGVVLGFGAGFYHLLRYVNQQHSGDP